MKTVYICAPLEGDFEGNIDRVKKFVGYALISGTAPVVPHFFALCDDAFSGESPLKRQMCVNAGLNLMYFCDEIWVFGKNRSESMKKEIDYATRKLKIPIVNISDGFIDEFILHIDRG